MTYKVGDRVRVLRRRSDGYDYGTGTIARINRIGRGLHRPFPYSVKLDKKPPIMTDEFGNKSDPNVLLPVGPHEIGRIVDTRDAAYDSPTFAISHRPFG